MSRPALRPEIRQPVVCPPWCHSPEDHLTERWVEDVYHQGPELPAITFTDESGREHELIEVQVWTSHDAGGQIEPVRFAWRAAGEYEAVDLTLQQAQDAVKRLRAHLDAVEAYIDRYAP